MMGKKLISIDDSQNVGTLWDLGNGVTQLLVINEGVLVYKGIFAEYEPARDALDRFFHRDKDVTFDFFDDEDTLVRVDVIEVKGEV